MDGCRSWGMKVKNISRKEGKINGLLTDCVIVVSPPPSRLTFIEETKSVA